MRGVSSRWIKVLCALLIVTLLPIPGLDGVSGQAAESVSIMQSGYDDASPYLDAAMVRKVESEEYNTYVLLHDGTVWAWGSNNYGQLGNGEVGGLRRYPARIDGLPAIADIAAGKGFVLALDESGRIWQWGCVGYVTPWIDGCEEPILVPEVVEIEGQVKAIDAGAYLAMALTQDGTAWTWGSKIFAGWGEESNSTYNDWGIYDRSPRPVLVDQDQPLPNVKQIAGGLDFALALTDDGKVYSWGVSTSKGTGFDTNSNLKFNYANQLNLEDIGRIASSSVASVGIAITNQGLAYGWSADNVYMGMDTYDRTPRRLEFFDGMREIAVGDRFVMALDHNGNVWVTGYLTYSNVYAFREFRTGNDIVKIYAGFAREFLLTSEEVITAGWNTDHLNSPNAYNLLGNGVWGQNWSKDTHDFSNPFLPMASFETLPVGKVYEIMQQGTVYEVTVNYARGHFDSHHFRLYDEDDNLIWSKDDQEMYDSREPSPFFRSPNLTDGKYRLEAYVYNSEWDLASVPAVIHFELKPIRHKLYLYGAPENFNLRINEEYLYSDGDYSGYKTHLIDVAHIGRFGNYDIYEFDRYPGNVYSLRYTSGYWYSNSDLDTGIGTYSVASVFTNAEPEFYDDSLEYVDGKLNGWLYLEYPQNVPVQKFALYFTDAQGAKIGDELGFEEDEDGPYREFADLEVPDGAAYLQLFMQTANDDEPKPTRYRKWLEPVRFPSMTVIDRNPAIEKVRLDIEFGQLEHPSHVAFYKIVLESPSRGGTMAILPADSTNLALPEFDLNANERLMLHFVDIHGNTSAWSALVPVADDMTAELDLNDVYGRKSGWYIIDESISPPARYTEHFDTDPRGSYLEGVASWSAPAGHDGASFVYDVYYGDAQGNIYKGLARVWAPEYRFEAGSRLTDREASLVVAAIMGESDYALYHPKWLTIRLNDFTDASGVLRKAFNLETEDDISLSRVVEFVLAQLGSSEPLDVTGDWRFDRDDVRKLLEALTH